MRPVVVWVAGTVLAAAAMASYAVAELSAPDLAGFLARHHALPYAIGLWWVVVAPLPLLLAGALVRRTPWPWVVVCTVHLGVLLAVSVRLHHLVPTIGSLGIAVAVGVGLASVVAAVAVRPAQ